MKHQIDANDVRLGMYVCGFGGSWFDHPFWRVKRLLDTPELVAKVRESGVAYVEIDDTRGLGPAAGGMPAPSSPRARPSASRPLTRAPVRAAARSDSLRTTRQDSEKQRAKALVARSLAVVKAAFADARLGRAVQIAAVRTVVDDVVGTLERTPQALLEVIQLKRKDEYTYLHSVAVCTLMANAALHLGRGDAVAREYGMAGLLHDLGKMGTPDEILNKDGSLTQSEFTVVQGHPEFGYQLLQQSPDMPPAALDVCRHHHEKIDGTGYPFGLPGEAISDVARLGAICDVYDALTSERSYKQAMPPLAALGEMWTSQGHFDRELLFKFMQSLGLFPAGMVVQLRSQRLAVVREPRGKQKRTRVLAFYDQRERQPIEPADVPIGDDLAHEGIVAVHAVTEATRSALLAARRRLNESEIRGLAQRAGVELELAHAPG